MTSPTDAEVSNLVDDADADREGDAAWTGGSVIGPGFRLVRRLVRPHPVPFALSIFGALVFAGGTVLSTVVLGRVIDDLVIAGSTDGDPSNRTLVTGILAVMVVAVGRAIGVVMRRYFAGMTSERAQHQVRGEMASSYLTRPLAWFQTAPTGQLLAHVDSDARMLVEVLHPLPFSIGVVGLGVFAAIALLVVDVWIALVALLIFPIMTISNQWYSKIVEKPMAESQERLGDVAGIAHESFEGALIVKTLGRTDSEVERFTTAAEKLRAARVRSGVLRVVMNVTIAAWPAFGTLVVVLIGAFRVRSGDMTAGDIVQVAALFTLLAVPMAVFGFFLESLAPSLVANRRIRKSIGAEGSGFPDDHPTFVASPKVRIERGPGARLDVDSVSYGFERSDPGSDGGAESTRSKLATKRELAVDGVSFTVEPGQTVAIVGATGSGKSTLVALVAGLLSPSTGTVRVAGQDVAAMSPGERARCISLVFQESFLLADSVHANIAMSRTLTAEEVENALRLAEAWDFVAAMPEGVHTILGERGLTVSGGQRQRLALARAFAQPSPLVILDDATSAVDTVTEQRILASLRTGGASSPTTDTGAPTLLVVAHRLATIGLADRVVWMRDGAIAAIGRHQELMTDARYEALVTAYEQADA